MPNATHTTIPAKPPVPVNTVKGLNEDGDATWLLEYFLETFPNSLTDGAPRYGIAVKRTNPDGTADKSSTTGPFSEDRAEVLLMIECFSKNLVHPYVINDMVSEWYSSEAMKEYSRSGEKQSTGTYHLGDNF